jgi:hypothetical protein
MPLDKKDLEKFSPEERIKRLGQMEEDRKKDGQEIEALISQSMKELRTNKIADEVAPEQKPVDISKLFGSGSGSKLEKTARRETSGAPSNPSTGSRFYQAVAKTYEAYSELKSLYGVVSQGGTLSEDQLGAIRNIGQKLDLAEKYLTESEKIASKLDASRIILYRLIK